jgi:hypothetical protein
LTSATHSTPAPSTAALGTGVVKVTLGGKEYTVGGGDCAKGFGGDFFVVEAGDWLNGIDPAATSDFVSVSIYNDGSAQHAGGRVGGTKFFYSDATGTGDITKGGTFTGTDAYGAGTVSGTFSCK